MFNLFILTRLVATLIINKNVIFGVSELPFVRKLGFGLK